MMRYILSAKSWLILTYRNISWRRDTKRVAPKPPDYFLAFVTFTGFNFEPFPCIRRIVGTYCTRPIRKMPDFLRKKDGK